jgi:hypothetical protein
MSRGLIIAVALSAAIATTAGCGVIGGSSSPSTAAGSASAGAGISGAAASPATPSGATAGQAGSGQGAAARAGAGQPAAGLAGCLVGGWRTPASREFTQLGMTARSKGAISGASGVLRMRFTADHGFTFTYDGVKLVLGSGQAQVNGPITGSWALAGNVLTATVKKSSVKMAVMVGGMSVNPSGSFDSLLRSITPRGAATTCSRNLLSLKVPTDTAKKEISIVTFDRG